MTRESAVNGAVFRDMASGTAARLHSAARDGNVRARLYVLAMVVAGCVMLSESVAVLWTMPLPVQWWALLALTLMAGAAVLKIPAVPVNFSISDVFTLTAAVVYGPHAGAVMVAVDSLVISALLTRRGLTFERILFNAVAPPVAMWVSASAYYAASGLQPLSVRPLGLDIVGPWLFVFAALYFFLNTSAIAVAIALDQRENAIRIWRSHFQNLWLTFIGGALGASFVVFALQFGNYGVIVLAVPLVLAMILHFAYRNATGRVADQLAHLAEVSRLHLSTIEALARAVDAKDGVTSDHIRRVQTTALALAKRIGVDDVLELRAIEAAALLHDVGKLAIPEHILNKPGRLTPAEFERMKTHAQIGADILSEVDFPYPLVPIVRHHHENWDGTGYPAGLSGDAIPVGARILAVVDCFDALTSHRPYRRALSVSDTFAIIDGRRGTMYDPAVVDEFHKMYDAGDVSEAESADHDAGVVPPPKSGTNEAEVATSDNDLNLALKVGAVMMRGGCTLSALAFALREVPEADTVAVYAVDEAQQHVVARHVAGRHASAIEGLTIAIGERTSGWVAAMGKPMMNADAALDLFDVQADGLQSALVIPCQASDSRTIVALYSTRKDAFGARHEPLVRAAVAMLADINAGAQVVPISVARSRALAR